VVPMTKMLRAALQALPHRTGRVLRGRTRTKGVERKTLTAIVRAAELAAGLPPTGRMHVLRHSYASHLAIAGQSLYHLQAALGHQDHGTTQGYAKLSAEALRPLAAAIDARRGDPEEIIPAGLLSARKESA
jgi:site-specific recombinase XerD